MSYMLIVFVIILDQLSKYLIYSRFAVHESIPIIKNFFHLTYVQNMGAAFGILQNQKGFFIFMTLFVISGIFLFVHRQNNIHKVAVYSLSMIVAGAIGNFIDRVRLGYVVDFFDFRIWPVFNIADISIVVGAILLSYYIIFLDRASN
ncbi:signal peptidase II [Clostridiaceae bacterium 35-E11]